jgi:hypothetical protein
MRSKIKSNNKKFQERYGQFMSIYERFAERKQYRKLQRIRPTMVNPNEDQSITQLVDKARARANNEMLQLFIR